jgi:uncharacterized DUF497 family protein
MNFEWDDAKRKLNMKKLGIDFINASKIFDGYTLTIVDDRYDYGEERFVTFGILEGRVVVVVHTENEHLIRIISIRKATKYEEKRYFSQIPD